MARSRFAASLGLPSPAALAVLFLFAAALLLTAGCDAAERPFGADAVRDTLPDGTVRVRYGPLPPPVVDSLRAALRIGVVEGEEHEVFGDIRGIEAGLDGAIYVLDAQASELRVFEPDGRYRGTIARRGEGPGELTRVNGMVRALDGTLWVQDHGRWQMIGIAPAGGELARVPMHVRSYGYIFNGALDERGRFWKPASHSDAQPGMPPQPGLAEGTSRAYLSWYDPATEASDSIYLGERAYRTYVAQVGETGWSYRGIPFSPAHLAVVDPGGGFWTNHTEAYRIARLDESGDTVLVIEVQAEPLPVTREDRRQYVDQLVERDPGQIRAAEAVAALMPERKPVVAQLAVDDEGRVWVRPALAEGEPPRYDVFTRDGHYAGSVTLGFEPVPYFPPRIREGRLYTLTRDSLDVQSVVRADLPPEIANRPATREGRNGDRGTG